MFNEGKKILFLGAAAFQVPPIEYALSKGYQAITCDNVASNPGHRLAHKSFNVSTVDAEAVLQLAVSERIDGILTFGSDVSAASVAYVGEKLGLSAPTPQTVSVLTNKSKFRHFLQESNLQYLPHETFSELDKDQAFDYVSLRERPIVVKPVDASGSKGVSVAREMRQLSSALEYAFKESRSKTVIVEDFVSKSGSQICGDGFMLRGRLAFIDFGDGHFYDDDDFMAPFAESFPAAHPEPTLQKTRQLIERILQSAGFFSGPFNFDALIKEDGVPFVIELGPRSGGNYIPTALSLKNEIDLVGAAVELCLDPDYCVPETRPRNESYYACYMLHSRVPGTLKGITFSPELKEQIVAFHPYLKVGDPVLRFNQASHAIGNLVLKFSSPEQMRLAIARFSDLHSIALEPAYAPSI